MNAILGSVEPSASKVLSGVHDSIVKAMVVLDDQGTIAEGALVAKDKDGKAVAHKKVADVAMTGTVDGSNKTFTATLAPAPVLPGTVKVVNNNTSAQELEDDGNGNLVGDGTGTVIYATGEISATLTTAPASGKTVLVSHRTKPVGVAIQEIDTDDDDAALVAVHGAVNADLLLTRSGSSDIAADSVDIDALAAISLYAM